MTVCCKLTINQIKGVDDLTNGGRKKLTRDDEAALGELANDLGLHIKNDRNTDHWTPNGIPTDHIHVVDETGKSRIRTKKSGDHIPVESNDSNGTDVESSGHEEGNESAND